MSRDSDTGSNLVFFLLGAATGAAVALLFAPHPGETTRKKISEKASVYRDKAADATQQARESITAVSNKVQDLINRVSPERENGVGPGEPEMSDPAEA